MVVGVTYGCQTPPLSSQWAGSKRLVLRGKNFVVEIFKAIRNSNLLCPAPRGSFGVLRSVRLTANRVEGAAVDGEKLTIECPVIPLRSGRWLASAGMRAKPTRRDLLKTTATLAATGALALNRAALAGTKEPADAAAGMLPQVDAVLGTAVSAEDVPGVVAMAATEAGVVYEGVFGSRRIHEGPAMTRHTILIIIERRAHQCQQNIC